MKGIRVSYRYMKAGCDQATFTFLPSDALICTNLKFPFFLYSPIIVVSCLTSFKKHSVGTGDGT